MSAANLDRVLVFSFLRVFCSCYTEIVIPRDCLAEWQWMRCLGSGRRLVGYASFSFSVCSLVRLDTAPFGRLVASFHFFHERVGRPPISDDARSGRDIIPQTRARCSPALL